jgi:hypothetical protein
MNKQTRQLTPMILIFLVIITAGCSTTLPRGEGEETLLVIPLVNERSEGVYPFGYYYLVLNEKSTGEVVKEIQIISTDDYRIVSGLPEGEYYISSYYFVFKDSKEKSEEEKGNFPNSFCPVTLSPGILTLSPLYFGTKITGKGGLFAESSMELIYGSHENGEIKNKTLELLEENYPETFSSWRIED